VSDAFGSILVMGQTQESAKNQ